MTWIFHHAEREISINTGALLRTVNSLIKQRKIYNYYTALIKPGI